MARTKNEANEALKKSIVKKSKEEGNVGKKVGGKPTGPAKPTKKRLSDLAVGGIKKPHRFHSGTRALMDIRKYQSRGKFATMTLIPKKIMYDVVKEGLAELSTTNPGVAYKLKRKAFVDLHQACEQEVLKQMECANLAAIHAKKQGIEAADLQAANLIRDNHRARPIVLDGFAIKGKRVRKRTRSARPSKSEQVQVAAKKVYQGGKPVKQPRKAPIIRTVARPDFGDDSSGDEEEVAELERQQQQEDDESTAGLA